MHNTLFKMMLVGLLLLGIGNTTTAHAAPTLEETKKYLSDRLVNNAGKTLEFNLEGKDKCNFYKSGVIRGGDIPYDYYEYIKLSSIYYESVTYKTWEQSGGRVSVAFIRDPSSPSCATMNTRAHEKFHWYNDQKRRDCNWITFGPYDGEQLAKAVKHAAKLCGAKPKPEILFE